MTAIHPFDQAIAIEPAGPRLFRATTAPAYGMMVGPFGGFIAAILLRAVLDDAERRGDPVALTVNFCGAIGQGDFDIATKLQRAGKYTQHWSLELTQGGETKATATVLLGVRGDTFAHEAAPPPDAPGPNTIEPTPAFAPNTWIDKYEFRFIEGGIDFPVAPFESLRSPRTLAWVKDAPDRPLDYLSLAALSDTFFFRLLHVRGAITPNGTATLTTYFHGTADEIAAQGTASLLGAGDANRFNANFHDQSFRLWGASGKLLASGVQIVWYKE